MTRRPRSRPVRPTDPPVEAAPDATTVDEGELAGEAVEATAEPVPAAAVPDTPEVPTVGQPAPDVPTADEPTDTTTLAPAVAAEPDLVADPDRPTALRIAGLHLRTGLLQLALAELEALAQRDALDASGLADLAEARWRSGDLEAAGTVAVELVDRGSTSALLLAIAAEAVAADGRTTEARELAARALDAAKSPLDTLFAGLPRHAIWPEAPVDDRPTTAPSPTSAPAIEARTTSSAAAGAFAGGRAALSAQDHARAARRLGVALRLDPAFARQVLEVVGAAPTDPELALVAGDALRILGREQEALAAFDLAREGDAPLPAEDRAQEADLPDGAPRGGDPDGDPED